MDKEFCLERFSGNYVDLYDCLSFYLCLLEEMKKEICLRGLYYNYNMGECDWFFNVKCVLFLFYKFWICKVFVYKLGNDKVMIINGFIIYIMVVVKRCII